MRVSTPRVAVVCVLVAIGLPFGSACASHATVDPQASADRLRERTGATARTSADAVAGVPAGITLEDGVTQEEAVALALWNSADFQVSLSELGFARADLLEAGLLTNPILSLLFPVGVKQFEGWLRLPIEVLWQRPRGSLPRVSPRMPPPNAWCRPGWIWCWR